MLESRMSIVEEVCVVELQWRSMPIDRNYAEFKKTAPSVCHTVYAFEGRHEAHPTKSILYIGQTNASKGQRPLDSAYERLYCASEMSCCYGDVTLRWADIPAGDGWRIQSQDTPVDVVERVLIHAMKPALNSANVDGWLPEHSWFRKLILCNKGDKGMLLPVVYGDYYASGYAS